MKKELIELLNLQQRVEDIDFLLDSDEGDFEALTIERGEAMNRIIKLMGILK